MSGFTKAQLDEMARSATYAERCLANIGRVPDAVIADMACHVKALVGEAERLQRDLDYAQALLRKAAAANQVLAEGRG